jgi:DNA-binding NarL/FixJ family response regulator
MAVETTRVLLVDDQEIVRQGLATILRYEEGIEVVGEAADGEQAIAQALQLQPDVILMDIKMPRLGGIPATRKIKQQLPQTEVIILTTYDTDDLVFEGIKAGASGYLLKDVSSEVLVSAIQGVRRGESQLDPKVAHKVLGEFKRLLAEPAPRAKARPEEEELILTPLTEREEEVLQLLAEGLSNKEIAARLYLTEGTVKNHISNILGKLQANDRTHAVIRALRHGLVEL